MGHSRRDNWVMFAAPLLDVINLMAHIVTWYCHILSHSFASCIVTYSHTVKYSHIVTDDEYIVTQLFTTVSIVIFPAAISVASYRSSKHSGTQSGKHSSKDADTNGSEWPMLTLHKSSTYNSLNCFATYNRAYNVLTKYAIK